MTSTYDSGFFYAPYIPNGLACWWKDLPYIEYEPALLFTMTDKKLDAMVFCIKS